ncbi:bifunctional 4-alpha-glucanotransferase/amylo-alpha-1,6-glucosidase, partial [Dimargaris xerosporica]
MASAFTVYTLQLNENGEPGKANEFIRLPAPFEPYGLRFQITAGSEAANDPVLRTNYPLEADQPAERTRFYTRPFSAGTGSELVCDLSITLAGPFQYTVEYTTDSTDDGRNTTRTAYFIVDPLLAIRSRAEPRGIRQEAAPVPPRHLPLDGIVLQTMVPKWMGPIDGWNQHLVASAQLGYNMIHFAPLQKRGASNSPYSLYDQLALSDDLFTEKDRVQTEEDKYEILSKVLLTMEAEHSMLGMVDMVWNHTSSDSDWLQDHPEAGYNLANSPHLVPAFEVDEAILAYSAQLGKLGLPTTLASEADLDRVIGGLREQVITKVKLWEYYGIDVTHTMVEIEDLLNASPNVPNKHDPQAIRRLKLHEKAQKLLQVSCTNAQPAGFQRNVRPDAMEVLAFMKALCGSLKDVQHVLQHVRQLLNEVNVPRYELYDQHVDSILTNVRNTVKYERLDPNGPHHNRPITADCPLVPTYFTRLPDNARAAPHQAGSRFLANNGWVWNGDALTNFAEAPSTVYLERKLIVWSDCVKLRYGKAPQDNPWLWDFMKRYAETMATYFHGFRIDNCHSTPIELAEYLLDCARRVRPNLYVVAELFTGSEDTDRIFVSRLGINSLIREALAAWDSFELSRQVHRSGGKAIGSMDTDCLAEESTFTSDTSAESPVPCHLVPLRGSLPHALFTECTHDNPTPTQKRTSEDALPNAALVALTCSATGSVKGYDELYPRLLELPAETRQYQLVADPLAVGLGEVKQTLQRLHYQLAAQGYHEVHVHHETEYVMVHRQHPRTREGYLMVAHTAFPGSQEAAPLAPVKLRLTTVEPILAKRLYVHAAEFQENPTLLTGLPSQVVDLDPPHLVTHEDGLGRYTELTLPAKFGPGSILLVKTSIPDTNQDLDALIRTGADDAVADLDLLALNTVLYRCDAEERDIEAANGTYNIPGVGSLPYCGLQGFMSTLLPVIRNNDLGHPVCDHLRSGQWALDYVVNRLRPYLAHYPALGRLIAWFDARFTAIRKVPNFLLPKYFALTLHTAHRAAVKRALSLMAPLVRRGDPFIQALALCSVQCHGLVKSTGLHPTQLGASLAAGLPHFATAHMRCWGRDVFMSLPGLLLATGQYDAARAHLLAFASTIRHGLIPNLLDSLRRPRYNARDAAWWFLHAVQEYCRKAPEGLAILDVEVARRFPRDDQYVDADDPRAYAESSLLADIVHEIVSRHAAGIHFREWNAGPELDHAMRSEGFQIDIATDWDTGFVHGGNEFNCGTWMDKMGDSAKANIMGTPGTPRDGAAIEIVGLVKSTLRWLHQLSSQGKFPHRGVEATINDAPVHITYGEWEQRIQVAFEKHFYIPTTPEEEEAADGAFVEPHPELVNRRGIYKDTVGATRQYMDYQLRPNLCVAMAVAPELFTPHRAQRALAVVREHLAGPLGLKTLDPSDWAYRGVYDNSNDSDDPTVAHGINYHQGPEWVWCMGYYLQASLRFAGPTSHHRTAPHQLSHGEVHRLHQLLLTHKTMIATTPFAGLPELTNADGQHCADSCPTQAWSAGTILTFLEDLAAFN